jgi:DsbC/DsbD-like thiol-disulfide interchange protein
LGIYMDVRPKLKTLAVVFFALAAMAMAAEATTTKVELILAADAARPGSTVMAGIRLTMQPGWDTYWQNPGGPGIATEVKWTLPPGITAGKIQWPVPESLSSPPYFVNYVYTNEAILLVPLIVSSNAAAGSLNIQAHVSWQECSNICVTGETDVSASLTIGTESQPSFDAITIKAAKAKLPKDGSKLAVTAPGNFRMANGQPSGGSGFYSVRQHQLRGARRCRTAA